VDLTIIDPSVSHRSYLRLWRGWWIDWQETKFCRLDHFIPTNTYQTGKSVETALHQLVVRVEKALDQQELALGAFLDIEGAFNNTSYDSMRAALARRGVDYAIALWIRATPEGRRPPRLSVDFPVASRCPEAARREVFCRLSSGALLSIC